MAMPGVLRVAGGWYEEDCEWAKVAIGFPDLFTDYERCHADRTLRDYYPECWEAVHGRAQSKTTGDGRSEEHTSELQSLMRISYAGFCLKKKKLTHNTHT